VHGLALRLEAALEKEGEEPAFEGNWTPEERRAVKARLDQLPPRLVGANPGFHAIARKPVLNPKPPGAPGDSKYEPSSGRIVLYDKGVYDGGRKIKEDHLSRSVFHELAHTLEKTVPKLFENWKAISGWTQRDGKWVATLPKAGFVDDYAKTSPYEDWAETFQEYFVRPEIVRKRFPLKYRFVEHVLAAARRGELKFKEKTT
jgi:hypothetical protein